MPSATPSLVASTLVKSGAPLAPQYLTGLDLQATHGGTSCALVYPQGLDADGLVQSLAGVLAAYPVLSGRLRRDAQGYVFIDPCDTGVAFLVKRHAHGLPHYGHRQPLDRDMARYFTRIMPWQVVDRPKPLMTIELHQFAGGGALLTFTTVHSVCDGGALWSFLLDWARVHRGGHISPPALDRNAVIRFAQAQLGTPCETPTLHAATWFERCALHARFAWQYLTALERRIIRIGPQEIQQWRQDAKAQGLNGDGLGAHDLAVAHCLRQWSAHTHSRSPRQLSLISDLRYRRNLGLSLKYVGNALGRTLVAMSPEQIAQGPLQQLAQRCHVSLDQPGHDTLLGYMGFMERHRLAHTSHTLVTDAARGLLEAGMLINNGAHLPFYKMDFGQGGPSWIETERTPYRSLILTPTPAMDGGFDVRLTAPRSELAAWPLH
jgi:shikimate O-hydroxycinnamoyltransferase